MKNKKLVAISVVIVLVLSLLGYFAYTGYFVKTENARVTAVVARVIDGDTVELTTGDRVRLIGIDAEEKGEKCYKEAKDRLKELVEGKDVFLESDVQDKDRYGRLLRYVFLDDTFVNLLLVREGLAKMYIIKPNIKYASQFEQAFLLARNENGCLWRRS
jgi:micrococcal nuclease